MTPAPRRFPADQAGFAMAGLLMVVLLLAAVGMFSVAHTALDTRSTAHYDTANRAFFAAESGVLHALSEINGPGVIHFQSDVVNRWGLYMGDELLTMPNDAKSGYTVSVTADATDPRGRGVMTAVGSGPLLARRTIQINLRKGALTGVPGTIHLAADDNVTAQFSGNAFTVDGNNHNRWGNTVNDGKIIPGISTRNEDNASEVVQSLSNNQKDNVKGTGFSTSPLTPSVLPVGGPGIDDLDQFVADLLTNPTLVTTSTRNFNGNDVFGTMASPRVTYMTNPDVRLNGNAEGAGILIVDGSITINGTLDFLGLIIVRGDTIINATADPDDQTIVLGNATILGSLWTGNLAIRVGGSAAVQYCFECLSMVDTMGGQTGLIPRPMQVASWGEVL